MQDVRANNPVGSRDDECYLFHQREILSKSRWSTFAFSVYKVCFNSLAEVWPLGLPKAKRLWQTSFALVCSITGSQAPNPRVPKMATPNACAGQAAGKFAYTQGFKVLCTKFRCACKLMQSMGVDIAKRSQVRMVLYLSQC